MARGLELHGGGQTRAIAAYDGRGAVRARTVNLRNRKLALERVGQADHHEAEVHQHHWNDTMVVSWPSCWLAVAVNTDPTLPHRGCRSGR
jgi:hypothetical protein